MFYVKSKTGSPTSQTNDEHAHVSEILVVRDTTVNDLRAV